MSKVIYPEKVLENSNIGTVAMSCGAVDEVGHLKVSSAKENFEMRGFNIIETESIFKCEKFVSTSGEKRAEEFMSLWSRDDIAYIPVLRGGEFLMESIPYLDKFDLSKFKPKWVQGYSDVSLLNFYLTTKYNIATIHSNSFTGFAMKPWDDTVKLAVDVVQNKETFTQESFEKFQAHSDRSLEGACAQFNCTEEVVYKNLFGEQTENVKISGRLIGGCMDVIKLLIGTPFDNTKKFCAQFEEGMLWYLENCELSVLEMKRTLWQMKQAGWFENAKGFIIGRTNSKEQIWDFTYEDAMIDVLKDLNVSVIYDVDVGHTDPQWTMVNGTFAAFEYENGKGKITQYLR